MAHCHYWPTDGNSNDVCSGLPVVFMKIVINTSQLITDYNEMLTDAKLS